MSDQQLENTKNVVMKELRKNPRIMAEIREMVQEAKRRAQEGDARELQKILAIRSEALEHLKTRLSQIDLNQK